MHKTLSANNSWKLFGILMVLTGIMLFSGCAGTHMYNKNAHETMIKIKTDLDQHGITASIDNAKGGLSEILAEEREAAQQQALSIKDGKLISIIGAESDWISQVKEYIEKRKTKLISVPLEDFITINNKLDSCTQNKDNIKETYDLAKEPSDPELLCSYLFSDTTYLNISEDVKGVFNMYLAQCSKCLNENFNNIGGEVGDVTEQLSTIAALEFELNSELQAKTKEYKNALNKHKSDVKSGAKDEDLAKTAKSLISKLRALGEVSDKLKDKVNNSGAAKPELKKMLNKHFTTKAKIAKLKEQRKHIGALTSKSVKNDGKLIALDGANADIKSSIAVVSSISSLSELCKSLKTPPMHELILENERLRITIEGLKKQVVNTEARISLLKQKRDAMEQELIYLKLVEKALDSIDDSCNKETLISNFSGSVTENSVCSEKIGRVLLNYANSWNLGRVVQEDVDYQLFASYYNESLDNSTTALTLWNNLISVPISQLEEYYAGGITPDEFAKFLHAVINAIGLTSISLGVN